MKAMYRHDVMLKVNRDRGVRKLEKRRDEADTRVRLAEDAARKLKSIMSPERAAAIRLKRGMEARERDRPRYKSMPEHKLMGPACFTSSTC